MDLKQIIRTIPDFPEKGVLFRDITTVLKNPAALRQAVDDIAANIRNVDADLIIGPESRGFIFGVPVAYRLEKGFIPVRKAGKLPYVTVSKSYDLEYASASMEMHIDAISKGQRVAIVDDLLATGGTSKALAELIEDMGGVVAHMAFLIELMPLGGRKLLEGYDTSSIIQY